jgi:hypothetical protein
MAERKWPIINQLGQTTSNIKGSKQPHL